MLLLLMAWPIHQPLKFWEVFLGFHFLSRCTRPPRSAAGPRHTESCKANKTKQNKMNDRGLGADGGQETDYPLGIGWDVAICEESRSLRWIYVHPTHQALHETSVPVFLQQQQAGFRMVYERVCHRIGKNESIKTGDVVQASDSSFQVLNVFVFYMRSKHQAAVGIIGGRVKGGNASAKVNSALSYLLRKHAHFPAQEFRDSGCDIERERGEGHDERSPSS